MVDFKELYSYFSHNFRTNIATIIATIEAAKLELIDIKSNEMNSVYESAYLLDLFDASLSICVDHISGKQIEKNNENINPNIYIKDILNELSSYIKENSYRINMSLKNFNIISNEFVIKNFTRLICAEMFRLSPKGFDIKSENNKLIFKPINHIADIPKIFELFKEILNNINVIFTYSKSAK